MALLLCAYVSSGVSALSYFVYGSVMFCVRCACSIHYNTIAYVRDATLRADKNPSDSWSYVGCLTPHGGSGVSWQNC